MYQFLYSQEYARLFKNSFFLVPFQSSLGLGYIFWNILFTSTRIIGSKYSTYIPIGSWQVFPFSSRYSLLDRFTTSRSILNRKTVIFRIIIIIEQKLEDVTFQGEIYRLRADRLQCYLSRWLGSVVHEWRAFYSCVPLILAIWTFQDFCNKYSRTGTCQDHPIRSSGDQPDNGSRVEAYRCMWSVRLEFS